MSILKYKDPKTGEFKRINPYKAELSFVGKDGIVVNKAANSEEVEISGSGCVQKSTANNTVTLYSRQSGQEVNQQMNYSYTASNQAVPRRDIAGSLYIPDSSIGRTDYKFAAGQEAVNRKYVDNNFANKIKFTNLEQALNGYILDTTKEAYADLDSEVLKNSVAVGNNVYPIADKTRALVTRIEGKTTKMVQLLDKSAYYNMGTKSGITATNNGDGSWTINGTATAEAFINFSPALSLDDGHKVLLTGNKTNSGFSLGLLNQQIEDTGNGCIGNIKAGAARTWGISWRSGAVINNVTITPQLFDLTAMNRKDITTAEQFKAEFPNLYPYENGNIYPAKIGGVEFTGRNLLKLELEPSLNAYNATASINGDILSITPTITEQKTCYAQLKTHLKAGKYTFSAVINNPNNVSTQFILSKKVNAGDIVFQRYYTAPITFTIDEEQDFYILIYPIVKAIAPFKTASYQMQIQAESQATAYEPYIEPVSVTLPETYELHGIGDYKDYLEITKNENNELYTLKKVQVIEKVILNGTENWNSYFYGDKPFTNLGYVIPLNPKFKKWTYRGSMMTLLDRLPTIIIDQKGYGAGDESATLYVRLPNIATVNDMKAHVLSMYEAGTPYVFYGAIQTPVETVIATNLTYEQVTAIRHNGGLIEVVGNTNKAYAKPTIKNTVVYRLTATNKAEG